MDDSGLFVPIVLVVLIGLGLAFGSVIGWFKYRRYRAEVDYLALGIGFLLASLIALLILLLTDGPWVIGIAFMVVGAIYLVRGWRILRGDTDRTGQRDQPEGGDATTPEEHAEPSRRDAPPSRIEVGDDVLLTTDVRLPRRDNDWQHETLRRGSEGVVLALVEDEDPEHEATGMTDTGVKVAIPAGVLVRVADHEYGVRDFHFSTGQVIVKRPGN